MSHTPMYDSALISHFRVTVTNTSLKQFKGRQACLGSRFQKNLSLSQWGGWQRCSTHDPWGVRCTKEGGDTGWMKKRNKLQSPNPSDQLPPPKPYLPNSQQPSKKFYSLGTKHIKHEVMGKLLDSIHNMYVKKLVDVMKKKKSQHQAQCVSPSLHSSCGTGCKILSYDSSTMPDCFTL